MRTGRARIALIVALVLATPPVATAFGADRHGANGQQVGGRAATGEGVDAYEIFVRWPAPLLQQAVVARYLPDGAKARWEVALSYWRADGDSATVLAAGPTLEYPLPADRWNLSFGVQPTVFSDYASEHRTLGGPFEFTSHLGARWQAAPGWYLGARIQHTSNAGIYERNPGVNLFALELGARF